MSIYCFIANVMCKELFSQKFAICFRCDTFPYLQISSSFWLLADFVFSPNQHIFAQLFLQTFSRVDRQVELNRKHRVEKSRYQQESAESRHAAHPLR